MAAKDRTLYVLKNLWENSDEEHPATSADILSFLASEDIKVERHALMSDIEKLTEFGIDIVCVKSSPNKYFIGQRTFELPELKLLVDAVASSKFITEKKSKELVAKLAKLASNSQADELKRNIIPEGRIKAGNENIYYIVDAVNAAINNGKQISFQYFCYNVRKQKAAKHDGEVYVFSPYYLIWNGDYYYAVGLNNRRFLKLMQCQCPLILV